jgi:hypothetical protein
MSLTFGRQGGYHTNTGRLQNRHALRVKHLGSRVFFPYGAYTGLVRTASALCRLLICCSAPKMQISHSSCGGSIAAFTKRRHDP